MKYQNTSLHAGNNHVVIDGKVYSSYVNLNKSTNKQTYTVQCFASRADRFCLPSWIIVAGAKSGSSALWQYICDNVGSKCSNKELYFHGQPLIPFIKENMGQNESYGSGNMVLGPLPDFLLSSNAKFIVLLRNPISFSYAAWNFWCNPLFDGPDCKPGKWASQTRNAVPRTADNFETLLETYCSGKPDCFANHGWNSWVAAERYYDSLSRNRLIIIRSEELAENVSGTLERLWKYLGLPNQLRHPDIVREAFNTGKVNGVENSQKINMALGRSYEPMTQRSRALLCKHAAYWSHLSYFVSKFQIKPLQEDLDACPN